MLSDHRAVQIHRLTEQLLGELDAAGVARALTEAVHPQINVSWVQVWLPDPDHEPSRPKQLVLANPLAEQMQRAPDTARLNIEDGGVIGSVAESRCPAILHDASRDSRYDNRLDRVLERQSWPHLIGFGDPEAMAT